MTPFPVTSIFVISYCSISREQDDLENAVTERDIRTSVRA